jgi:hypothetical protein
MSNMNMALRYIENIDFLLQEAENKANSASEPMAALAARFMPRQRKELSQMKRPDNLPISHARPSVALFLGTSR